MNINPNYTPDLITQLEPHQIFVFGSNTEGRHGKGAAKEAVKWGARYGQARGRQGQTYAICVKNLQGRAGTYPLHMIQGDLSIFYFYASVHSNLEFLVTKIGCGLGGFSPEQIAPLFNIPDRVIPSNVRLPKEFVEILSI